MRLCWGDFCLSSCRYLFFFRFGLRKASSWGLGVPSNKCRWEGTNKMPRMDLECSKALCALLSTLTWALLTTHHHGRAVLDGPTPLIQWEMGDWNKKRGNKTWSKQERNPRDIPISNSARDSAFSGSRWDPNTDGSGKMLPSWYFCSSRSQGNSRQKMDFPAVEKLGQTFELLDT